MSENVKMPLTLGEVREILFNKKKIFLDSKALKPVEEAYNFLEEFSKNKVIYGINTGLGPMAQYRVDEKDAIQLQYNLIRSHCTGTGNILSPLQAKACLLARLYSFLQGKSGVHPSVVILLSELINKGAVPVIYDHGGVGASGDLVQLAHVALFMIGEGHGFFNGNRLPAKEIFALTGLQPINIYIREGLGIMNGTSAMTGMGLINILEAKNLLSASVAAASLINELVESFDDHFSSKLNEAKGHYGQQKIAAMMYSLLEDSKIIKKRDEHLYVERSDTFFGEKVQEYYSIRCVPQILGPIFDTISNAEKVLINELNSANDNPIVDASSGNVYHGGNFHGDYVALEMDKLKIALTKLTMLAERQINYLLNSKLNEKFPPFLNMGTLGLNLGLQALQFTATSTTAESQTLSYPMYLHSIPNNGDNQDIVSMGMNAASLTSRVIQNGFQVMAIQMIMLTQAFEISGKNEGLSSFSKNSIEKLRKIYKPGKEDRTYYEDIHKMKIEISEGNIFKSNIQF